MSIKGLSIGWGEEMLSIAFFDQFQGLLFPCVPIRANKEDDAIGLNRLIGIGEILWGVPNR